MPPEIIPEWPAVTSDNIYLVQNATVFLQFLVSFHSLQRRLQAQMHHRFFTHHVNREAGKFRTEFRLISPELEILQGHYVILLTLSLPK